MTKFSPKRAGNSLGRAFANIDANTADKLAELKQAMIDCDNDKAIERQLSKSWKHTYQQVKGCSDGAARKAWSRYSSAALAGRTTTQTPADIAAKKAAQAKGTKDSKSGGATPSVVTQANEGNKADDQPSGKVSGVEILAGAVERCQQLRKAANNDESFTPKEIAAFCTDIIRRIETATQSQMDV